MLPPPRRATLFPYTTLFRSDVQQARDRPVDGIDLMQVDPVPETAQLGHVLFGQGQWGLLGQSCPFLTGALVVGGDGARRCSGLHAGILTVTGTRPRPFERM